jgi:hypothetical protein
MISDSLSYLAEEETNFPPVCFQTLCCEVGRQSL